MITRVKIKNINSIGECDLSFDKGKFQYLEDNVFHNKIVNPIAFYGINGSGKTSFLTAIWDLTFMMINDPDKINGFVPNFVNAISSLPNKDENNKKQAKRFPNTKSSIEIFFEIDNKQYDYFVETCSPNFICAEKLIINNNQIFVRKKDSYTLNNLTGEVTPGLFPFIRKLATDIDDASNPIRIAYDFLSNIAHVNANKSGFTQKFLATTDYRDVMVAKSNDIKTIIGKYNKFPVFDFVKENTPDGRKQYMIRLDVGKNILGLPLDLASSGMYNTSVLLTLALTLPKHGVLVIDEIEDALHPLTIVDFLQVIKDKDIQLIFTSHNTFILQQLRPDQIFFANWKDGYSTYKKLSDIYPNIRQVNNIEKMYLSGVFSEDINR